MQSQQNKKLLVIVVEEVLLCTASGGVKSEFEPSYIYSGDIASYPVFFRPQLRQFLDYCLSNYRVALWSELSPSFIHDAIQRLYGDELNPDIFEFIWDADKCVKPSDERYLIEGKYEIRNLCKSFDKIKEAGYSENEIIIIDNNPKHWEPLYEIPDNNWIHVSRIIKVFGNISIAGEPYHPDDESILEVIGKIEKRKG